MESRSRGSARCRVVAVAADGRHFKLLIAIELANLDHGMKNTPWSVRNIADALPEVHALALAQIDEPGFKSGAAGSGLCELSCRKVLL